MGRVMAVDWGSRRVGVALSDETRTIARPLETLMVKSSRDTAERLAAIVAENGVDELVLGFPLHMDGSEGESAKECRKLSEALGILLPGLRLVLVDERLSSLRAADILRERGERTRGRKERLDQVAASLLLQEYLDSGRP
jgi:putative holliday junction resolvase